MTQRRAEAPDCLHVLLTTVSFEPGGLTRHVLDLADALKSGGHRVTLAGTAGAWLLGGSPQFQELPLVNVTRRGGSPIRRCWALVVAIVKLRRLLRLHEVDLVHAHEVAPAFVAWLASRCTRAPLVLSFHGCEEGRERYYAWVAKLLAARVVAPGHRSADALARTNVLSRDQIDVIGYGIEHRPVGISQSARDPASLSIDGTQLVVVARLHRQKGIDILLDALGAVVASRPDTHLTIVGGGPEEAALVSHAERVGIEDRVTFVGHVDDPDPYLRQADLFVLPSRWEALPLSIVEAFNAGLPVVATDVGAVAELVDDSVGALVPPHDASALADAILGLLADDRRLAMMRAAVLARASEERFKPEHVHGRVISLYSELVDIDRASPA